jgi:hypothetical protein
MQATTTPVTPISGAPTPTAPGTPTTPTPPTTSTALGAGNAIAPLPQGTTQITQAALVADPPVPGIVTRTTFATDTIRVLTAADFTLDTRELIGLKFDDCILVLFYGENTESQQMIKIWALVAQQVAGPVFAAVNMLAEKRVAANFARLGADGSHSLHAFRLRQLPFILVYRKGWPVAFYNGARAVQPIIDYALTLACQANYYEPVQLGGSMQAEARFEMGPYAPYINVPGQAPMVRIDSGQFVTERPIRGFNPNLPLAQTGSTQATAETGTIRAEETALRPGGSLTGFQEAPPITTAPPITIPSVPGAAIPAGTPITTPVGPGAIATPANPVTRTTTPIGIAGTPPAPPPIATPATPLTGP